MVSQSTAKYLAKCSDTSAAVRSYTDTLSSSWVTGMFTQGCSLYY